MSDSSSERRSQKADNDKTRVQETRPSPPPSDRLVGRTIGGCEIQKWVGRGGMGAVYKARQVSLDRPVAFKVIGDGVPRDESLLSRFAREARTIARFNSNRIVQVYEVGFDDGIHFIVMEYLAGGDLKRKTRELGRIAPADALRYLRQAAEGLLAAERMGIVHRDLKPENLMLDAAGEVKITDFGLAKTARADHTLTRMGDYLGTPTYMSPEQAQGGPADHRSDMYALGTTFFFLLTGKLPYHGDTVYEILRRKIEFEHLDPGKAVADGSIPAALRAVIRKMTALQPEDRYPSFEDLIDDLDRLARGKPLGGSLARRLAPPLLAAALLAGIFFGLALLVHQAASEGTPRFPDGAAGPAGVPREEAPAPPVEARAPDPTPGLLAEAREIEGRLRAGGDATVAAEARALVDRAPASTDRGLRASLEALARDATRFAEVTAALASRGAPELTPPFAGLAARWSEIEKLLAAPAESGPALRDRLRAETERVLAAHGERLDAAAAALRARVEGKLEASRSSTAAPQELRAELELLDAARKNLAGAFPGALERWDRALPDRLARSLRAELERREGFAGEVGALRKSLAAAETRLASVKSLQAWAGVREALRRETEAAAQALAALRKRDGAIALADEERRLADLQAAGASWAARAKALRVAGDQLTARRIEDARRTLAALDRTAGVEAKRLLRAADALEEAFRALFERLEIARADELFEEARAASANVPGASSYPEACRARLADLRQAAANMVPVPAGRVRVRDAQPVAVDAFLIDRFEVSIRDYRAFLEALKKVDPAERARLGDGEDPLRRGEPRYLGGIDHLDQDWPIEAVSYFQARAYLRFRGKDLPSVEEWWLAARGSIDGGRRGPSGESWGADRANHPVPVTKGGESLHFRGADSSVHHLSGNVAEWSLAPPGATRTEAMGGSYRDSNPGVFSGEIAEQLDLRETRRGYGFRGALRPRELFRDLLPVAPAAAAPAPQEPARRR